MIDYLFFPTNRPSAKMMAEYGDWLSKKGFSVAFLNWHLLEPESLEKYKSFNFLTFHDLSCVNKLPQSNSGIDVAVNRPLGSGGFRLKKLGMLSKAIIDKIHISNYSLSILIYSVYWYIQILRFRLVRLVRCKGFQVKVVFTWGGDNAGTTHGDLINFFKNSGAIIVGFPVAMTDQSFIASLRARHPAYNCDRSSPVIVRLLYKFFPNQFVKVSEGVSTSYLHPAEIISMGLAGILPRNPWILSAGASDLVLVESDVEKRYWVSRGANKNKIASVGLLRVRNLTQSRLIIPDQIFNSPSRIFLLDVPNFYEHNIMHKVEDVFSVLDQLVEGTRVDGWQTIAALHPKADINTYSNFFNKHGIPCWQGIIEGLLSISDIYISCGSSTILIANSFSVKTVDVGPMFGFSSEVLRQLPVVQRASGWNEYRKLVRYHASQLSEATRFKSKGQGKDEVDVFEVMLKEVNACISLSSDVTSH